MDPPGFKALCMSNTEADSDLGGPSFLTPNVAVSYHVLKGRKGVNAPWDGFAVT